MNDINQEYLTFLEGKRAERPIKIPRYLSSDILQDRQLMKALCIWIELKPLFYDGRFKIARNNKKTLARYLCMSASAFNYKLLRLEKRGLISWENNGDMILCSWDKFFEVMGHRKTDSRKYKFYRLKNNFANSEYLFRYYAIKENFERQRAVIDKKIYEKNYKDNLQIDLLKQVQLTQTRNDIAILDRQRIVTELIEQIDRVPRLPIKSDSAFKKFKKRHDLNSLYMAGCRDYFNALKVFNYDGYINFDISVSCKRMAAIYGLSSSSSGHYWQQLMQGHFWRIENRSVFIKDMNTFRFNHERRAGELKHHYFEGNKSGVFRRLNNRLDLKEPEIF